MGQGHTPSDHDFRDFASILRSTFRSHLPGNCWHCANKVRYGLQRRWGWKPTYRWNCLPCHKTRPSTQRRCPYCTFPWNAPYRTFSYRRKISAMPFTHQPSPKFIPPKHKGDTLTPAVGERTRWYPKGVLGLGAKVQKDILKWLLMITKNWIGVDIQTMFDFVDVNLVPEDKEILLPFYTFWCSSRFCTWRASAVFVRMSLYKSEAWAPTILKSCQQSAVACQEHELFSLMLEKPEPPRKPLFFWDRKSVV